MRALMQLSGFAVLAGMCRAVLAQSVFGYNVSWGVKSVPISPWMSAAIGLLLLIATYAFIRRRAGQGLFMLATATLVGALSLHADDMANAAPVSLHSITTSSGSEFYNCFSPPSYFGYQNDTGKPLRLTLALVGGAPASLPLGGASSPSTGLICHPGDQELSPGGYCLMPCAS
jgi:hypothetical protein